MPQILVIILLVFGSFASLTNLSFEQRLKQYLLYIKYKNKTGAIVMNIFDKLEQDLSSQIQSLQAKQQELIEKKKNLVVKKEKIQNFLSSAQEVRQMIELEPELLKSVQKELGKIFVSHNPQQPKLPIKKEGNITPNLESASESPPHDSEVDNIANSDESEEEESIKIFKFVDAQGKNTSF